MEPSLLLVTPAPYPDESFDGYCLRLTFENGYEALRHLVQPFAQTYALYQPPKKPLIGRITGHSVHALVSKNDGQISVLNGNPVLTKYITGTKLCPECIEEHGYHFGLHCLKYVNTCIKHRRRLVDHCPTCSTFLDNNRSEFLKCKCQQDLGELPKVDVSLNCLDLESVIQAITYKKQLMDSNSLSGMPFKALSSMSLNTLFPLVEAFGLSKLWSKRRLETPYVQSDHHVTDAAAETFSNWPENFWGFLVLYGEMSSSSYNKRHNEWDSAYLTQTGNPYPESETQFIRDQYFTYIVENWRNQRDHTKLGSGSNRANPELSSLSIFATITGTTPDWVSEQCRIGKIHQIRLVNDTNKTKFILIKSDTQRLDHDAPCYLPKEAAEYLGVPLNLFNKLKNSGFLIQKFRVGKFQRFAKPDLDSFIEHLQPKHTTSASSKQSVVTFSVACKLKKAYGIFDLYLLLKMLKGEIKSLNSFVSINFAELDRSEVDRMHAQFEFDQYDHKNLYSDEMRCVDDQMLKKIIDQGMMIDQPMDYHSLSRI